MDEARPGSAGRRFPRDIGSLDAIFGFVREFFVSERLPDELRFGIEVSIEELFVNMVRHQRGGGGEVAVDLRRTGAELVVRLVDRDVEPFDPRAAPEARTDAPIGERRPGGLGIHFVRKLVDRIDYSYENRVSTTVLVKRLESGS